MAHPNVEKGVKKQHDQNRLKTETFLFIKSASAFVLGFEGDVLDFLGIRPIFAPLFVGQKAESIVDHSELGASLMSFANSSLTVVDT